MKKTLKPISNLRRKRRHGFLRRSRTRGGQGVLRRRRRERRKVLSV